MGTRNNNFFVEQAIDCVELNYVPNNSTLFNVKLHLDLSELKIGVCGKIFFIVEFCEFLFLSLCGIKIKVIKYISFKWNCVESCQKCNTHI